MKVLVGWLNGHGVVFVWSWCCDTYNTMIPGIGSGWKKGRVCCTFHYPSIVCSFYSLFIFPSYPRSCDTGTASLLVQMRMWFCYENALIFSNDAATRSLCHSTMYSAATSASLSWIYSISIRLHPVQIFANFKRFVVITSLILLSIYTEFRMRVSFCDWGRLCCSDRTIINPFSFLSQRDENHSSNLRISIQLIIDSVWLIRESNDRFYTPNPCIHSTVCDEDDLQFYWYPDSTRCLSGMGANMEKLTNRVLIY